MENKNTALTDPHISTWKPGTYESGPQSFESLDREQLTQSLQDLMFDTYVDQFVLSSGHEHATDGDRIRDQELVGRSAEFLADKIQVITLTDLTEEDKQQKIGILLDIVVMGEYEGTVVDLTYAEWMSEREVAGGHKTDNVNEASMFGKGTLDNYVKISRREGLARLYLRDPEIADHLVASGTIGLHGTRSGALGFILDQGLQSTSEIVESGGLVVSGEHVHNGSGQETVSLISWEQAGGLGAYAGRANPVTLEAIDTTIDAYKELYNLPEEIIWPPDNPRLQGLYSAIRHLDQLKITLQSEDTPEELKSRITENYPVIVGVTKNALEQDEVPYLPGGDIRGEFMIEHGISVDSFGELFVPEEKIPEVEKMCSDRGLTHIKVFDIESYRRAFINPEKYKPLEHVSV